MTKIKGVDILLLAQTGVTGEGDEEVPEYDIIGGQRGATLSEESDTMEVTAKDSEGNREYKYNLYGWTISADGVHVHSDKAYKALVDAMRNKQLLKVRVREMGSDIKEGNVLVTSRDLEAPYDGEATYSVELQGTGALTTVEDANEDSNL